MSTSFNTPKDVQQTLAVRMKARRLALNLTQEGLASRSGVSWGSIKRFEGQGQISLESLLKLCLVLDCLTDFENIAQPLQQKAFSSLDTLLSDKPIRKKGRLK